MSLACAGVVLKRRMSARGIGSDGFEQIAKLVRRTRVEPTIGPARQPGDLTECSFRNRIAPFLKHERRNAKQTQFARQIRQLVDILFHAVPHINQCIDGSFACFALGVREHLAKLRKAAPAFHARHQPRQRLGIPHPFGSAAFAKPAEVDQLDIEAANLFDLMKHVRLDLQGQIPGRLPAHRRIHSEDQPAPALAFFGRGGTLQLLKKRIDFRCA